MIFFKRFVAVSNSTLNDPGKVVFCFFCFFNELEKTREEIKRMNFIYFLNQLSVEEWTAEL